MDELMIWRQDSHMQRVYALIVVIYLYSVKSEQSRTRTRKVQARRGGGGGRKEEQERDDNSFASDVVASTASHAASPDCYTVLPYLTESEEW